MDRKPPVINGRIKKEKSWLSAKKVEIQEEEDGYHWRATRVNFETGSIVIVEYIHPNVGYWEEMCLFVSTMHCPDWQCIPLSNFWLQWREKRSFLRSFPAFKDLFRRRDYCREILKEMLGD
ncbi:MAG: hypothetical protein QW506_04460 [Thermoproteota archaeon]|nr:hypothetical protein [Candidatus Brockarchaeota archaeon]